MLDIDAKIKSSFKLFTGVRSRTEDRKIYDKIYKLCLDETINFIEENLDPSRKGFFIAVLAKLADENLAEEQKQQKLLEITFKYFQAIPHYRFRLNSRLESFLNNLVYQSAKERQKKN